MMAARVGLAMMVAAAAFLGWRSGGGRGARGEAPAAATADCEPHGSAAGRSPALPRTPWAPAGNLARARRDGAALPIVVLDDLAPSPPPPEAARDDAWAPGMERLVAARVAPRFLEMFPNAKVEVACATTTCDVAVEVDASAGSKVVDFAALAVPLGPAYSHETRAVTADRITIAFVVDLSTVREPEAWSAWHRVVDSSMEARVQEILRHEQRGESWRDVP